MIDFDELIDKFELSLDDEWPDETGCAAENVSIARTALTDAISAVTSERDALKDVIEGKAKLFMEEVMPTPNGFDIIGKHPLFGLFVHSILELFAELKADNYFEMQATRVDTGDMVILFQKKDGKTPHELRKEAEQERDALKAERDARNKVTENIIKDDLSDKIIANWREYYSKLPLERQTGGDLFIQKCLNAIESLRWSFDECMRQYDIQQERACNAEAKLAEANEDAERFSSLCNCTGGHKARVIHNARLAKGNT